MTVLKLNNCRRPRFACLPFGGGPRQCIGKDIALFKAVVVLNTAAQRFNWQLAPEAKVEGSLDVTLQPGFVSVMLKDRSV